MSKDTLHDQRAVGSAASGSTFAVVAFLVCVSASHAIAQCPVAYVETPNLTSRVIAIDESTLAVGDDDGDAFGEDSGRVLIFERNLGGPNAWGMADELFPFGLQAQDFFGRAVALDGDLLVAGAPGDDVIGQNSGSAFVFRRSTSNPLQWNQVAQLIPVGPLPGDSFGLSVAIQGSRIVVTGGQAVYVFESSSPGFFDWEQVAEINGPFPSQPFAATVDLDGDVIVVGARPSSDDAPYAGYVFERERDEWEFVELLLGPWVADSITPVDVSGHTLLLGWVDDDAEEGVVHLYERTPGIIPNWEFVTALEPNGLSRRAGFGFGLALDGDFAAVTTWNTEQTFVFERDEGGSNHWGQIGEVSGFDPPVGFGIAMQVPEYFVTHYGGARVFDLNLPIGIDCNQNGLCDEIEVQEGTVEDCNGNFVPDVCEEDQDKDGLLDSCDNCPMYANPDQFDCDDDGVGDVCEIMSGEEQDADDDGVIDDCDNCRDLPNPTQADCNGDGIGDVCAIVAGLSQDCDGSGVPDECETLDQYEVSTGILAPIYGASPQEFTFENLPAAQSDVSLLIRVHSDLDLVIEYIEVYLNGVLVGELFSVAGFCSDPPDEEIIQFSPETFNELISANPTAFVEFAPTFLVDPDACFGESWMESVLEYEYIGTSEPGDCSCPADLDGSGDVGFADLLILLDSWGMSGVAADLDGGGVGFSDLLIVLDAWGRCDP